ncbi:hypothetical protein Ancab_035612, partial [Ancistrocladus abbreviatus]
RIWVGTYKLRVSIVRGDMPAKGPQQVWRRSRSFERFKETHQRSYAEVVRTGLGPRLGGVSVEDETRTRRAGSSNVKDGMGFAYDVEDSDVEWLEGCVVGKVREVDGVQVLQERMRVEGGVSCVLRPMGGDVVLMSSRDKIQLAKLVAGGCEGWSRWFTELHSWKSCVVSDQRCVWLRCHGVSLHLWHKRFFQSLAGGVGQDVGFG